MPRVLASKLSLFGLPIKMAMERVQAVGFDGIEVLLTDRFKNYTWRCQNLAKELGLTLHFHQAWSSEEDPTDWKFRILELAGYLPRSGYILTDHIPCDLQDTPIVIQADRLNEFYRSEDIPCEYWFQTDSCWNFDSDEPRLAFSRFVWLVNECELPVVFDTQHYLEYRLGKFRNLSAVPTDKATLIKLFEEGWYMLGKYVKEIHLNDWTPYERNVITGTGIAPLKEFCEIVKSSSWNGYVVPEISPRIPLPHSVDTLKRLRDRVDSYFA